MDLLIYRLILALTFYLPFENFILKWIPVPDTVYTLLTFGSEIALYLILLKVFIGRIASGRGLRQTPIDVLAITFVVLFTIASFLNKASLVGSILNIRLLLRYLSVYYIVVNIDLSPNQISVLLKSIIKVGWLEGCLTFVQFFAGESFNNLFLPRQTELEIAGREKTWAALDSQLKVGSVIGTFGLPSAMSLFLLISLVLLITYAYRRTDSVLPAKKYLIGIPIILFGIFASYKRASLVVGFVVPIIVLFFYGRKRQFLTVIALYTTLIVAALSALLFSLNPGDTSFISRSARTEAIPINAYIAQIFTDDYWEQSSDRSRLWFIREVGGYVLSSGKLLGLGPDEQTARNYLANRRIEFQVLPDSKAFNDVYWVALLVYYGIIGLSIYLFMIYRLYKASKKLTINYLYIEQRIVGIAFCTVIIISLLYTFIERTFLIRTFAFYFWLLAGLVVNSCYVVSGIDQIQFIESDYDEREEL